MASSIHFILERERMKVVVRQWKYVNFRQWQPWGLTGHHLSLRGSYFKSLKKLLRIQEWPLSSKASII